MELKKRIGELVQRLNELEAGARRLRNQNFADVVKSAKGRVQQLVDHPDVQLVENEMHDEGTNLDRQQNPDGTLKSMPFDPKAGTDAAGSEIGGPDCGKPDTHVPGEPRFDAPNKDFQQPNAVDLNPDGTLRQAPNSAGAHADVRE